MQDIAELNEMFQDVAVLVHDQGNEEWSLVDDFNNLFSVGSKSKRHLQWTFNSTLIALTRVLRTSNLHTPLVASF